MSMTDEDVAGAVQRWWRQFYPDTPPYKVEQMVQNWLMLTSWGRELALEERVKLKNRVAAIIRSKNAVKAAATRKKNRAKAEEAVVPATQGTFVF